MSTSALTSMSGFGLTAIPGTTCICPQPRFVGPVQSVNGHRDARQPLRHQALFILVTLITIRMYVARQIFVSVELNKVHRHTYSRTKCVQSMPTESAPKSITRAAYKTATNV